MTTPRTVLTVATAAAALLLAGCANGTAAADPATSAAGDGAYPLTLESPFGETVLDARPERVAVVSSVDLDIALALGVTPVVAPRYGDYPLEPWTQDAVEAAGTELTFYDSTDGTDLEAIRAADPDVVLATSGWSLDVDYEGLASIAPVVSYEGEDGLAAMTWDERTEAAAEALGLEEEAAEVVAGVEDAFAAARASHPEFEGLTYTYAVVHPEQITYISHEGSDVSFFTDLGFTLPPQASEFDETTSGLAKENVDKLDADVLLVGYPFGEEGLLTQDALESDALFRQVPAVADGHYAVVTDEIASPLAYPTPLSQGWVLDRLVPILAQAVEGA